MHTPALSVWLTGHIHWLFDSWKPDAHIEQMPIKEHWSQFETEQVKKIYPRGTVVIDLELALVPTPKKF